MASFSVNYIGGHDPPQQSQWTKYLVVESLGSSVIRTFQGKLTVTENGREKHTRDFKSSHRGGRSQGPHWEDGWSGPTQGSPWYLSRCLAPVSVGCWAEGQWAAWRLPRSWEMNLPPWLSGPGGLGEDVGRPALCKAESAVSQLLTQTQMLLRSPWDGPGLRAPKKYQAGHCTRPLPRCRGPRRPCTDLRAHALRFLRVPSAQVCTHTNAVLGGTWRRAAEPS